jgi:MHS family proline/betaine transporter-like MFS transporter
MNHVREFIESKFNKDMALGSLGTVIEWYDYMLFGYMTVYISDLFFPKGNDSIATLSTWAIFAVGFMVRPLGGVIFGRIGDTLGRKRSLTLAVWGMAIPMICITLLPTYSVWGIFAPIALFLLCVAMGIATAGGYSSAIVYLFEEGKADKRAQSASYANMTSGFGVFLAAGASALLALADKSRIEAWAWRLPWAIGAFGAVVIAVLMSRRMSESRVYEDEAKRQEELTAEGPSWWQVIKDHPKAIWLGTWLSAFGAVAYYVIITYVPTWLHVVVGESDETGFILATLVSAVYALAIPFFGVLADRVGRKPPILISSVFLLILSIPLFALMTTGSLVAIYVGELLLLLPVMLFWGSFPAVLPEMFEAKIRGTGTGFSWNLGAAVLGGTSPLISTALVNSTGILVAPAFYIVAASAVMIVVGVKMKETAPQVLKRRAAEAAAAGPRAM